MNMIISKVAPRTKIQIKKVAAKIKSKEVMHLFSEAKKVKFKAIQSKNIEEICLEWNKLATATREIYFKEIKIMKKDLKNL